MTNAVLICIFLENLCACNDRVQGPGLVHRQLRHGFARYGISHHRPVEVVRQRRILWPWVVSMGRQLAGFLVRIGGNADAIQQAAWDIQFVERRILNLIVGLLEECGVESVSDAVVCIVNYILYTQLAPPHTSGQSERPFRWFRIAVQLGVLNSVANIEFADEADLNGPAGRSGGTAAANLRSCS